MKKRDDKAEQEDKVSHKKKSVAMKGAGTLFPRSQSSHPALRAPNTAAALYSLQRALDGRRRAVTFITKPMFKQNWMVTNKKKYSRIIYLPLKRWIF
jgi:hypothetical protein